MNFKKDLDYKKVSDVIESSETKYHMTACQKLTDAFYRKWHDTNLSDNLSKKLIQRGLKLFVTGREELVKKLNNGKRRN